MKKISVLVYFDTQETETIQRCFDSIFRTSGLPEEQVQAIALDAAGGWHETLRRQYGGNVTLIGAAGLEAPQAYNRGLAAAEGEYLSFLPASSCYSPGALGALFSAQKEEPAEGLLSLCPVYAGEEAPEQGAPWVSFCRTAMQKQDAAREWLPPVFSAYVVERGLLEGLRFREELHEEALAALLLDLLLRTDGRVFYQSAGEYRYTRPLADAPELCGLAEQKRWYLDSVRGFLLDAVRRMKAAYPQGIPRSLQRFVYGLLCLKWGCNLQGDDKQMMGQEETADFFALCGEIFSAIDNELLYRGFECPGLQLPRPLRMVFLRKKAEYLGYETKLCLHGKQVRCHFMAPVSGELSEEERLHDPAILSKTGQMYNPGYRRSSGQENDQSMLSEEPGQKAAMEEGVVLADISQEALDIRVINYSRGNLEIDAFFPGADYLEEGSFRLDARLEGKAPAEAELQPMRAYGLWKCFGVTYARKHGVRLEIPVSELLKEGRKLAFYVETDGQRSRLKLMFSTMSSRLLTYSQKSYWRFDHDRYMLTRTGSYLQVSRSSVWRTVKQELLFDAALLAQHGNRQDALSAVGARLLYWLTRPAAKRKRIWITFDKLYKAGDNGEYMFRYCQDQRKEMECYYVINRDAPDCGRLKGQYPGHVLYAGTWRARITALHAEAVLATHAGATTYLGFPGKLHRYFKDLYQADNICIQHGLSIQKIAHFQNRLYANTKLYCCASPYEVENVSRPVYGYSPGMLKLTGLARYDGLKNNEKKMILITPTWRKNAVHTKGVGMVNSHSTHFKETAYYRIYNGLINDRRLTDCAKEAGYRIVFLLHPAMSAQLEDYDQNGYVELMQATGDMSYEKILTEASLMVTDYSGVQFDFAYQRKPLVYYHPAELPPHYTEGGLIYDTMGFGPVCTGQEELVETLCRYIREGCRMEAEYRRRADRFFAFDDFCNARRICEAVLEFKASQEM